MNNNASYLTIPPRWLHCPRRGVSLAGGKFLAFKTPLGEQYDDQVPEEHRFTPSMLISYARQQKLQMGLWIDLTNTSRFYNKDEIEGEGVRYVKLNCRGHNQCPSVEQTTMFIQICRNFIAKNPLQIIGIHCTHGFNRTGFLISAFLVDCESFELSMAVHAFATARPPGIYKKDYLEELTRRFGFEDEILMPPELPSWHTECDDDFDDNGTANGRGSNGHSGLSAPVRHRREFQKRNAAFCEGVKGVKVVTDPRKLEAIQRKVQHMCEWRSNGFPGSQPVSMDCDNLKLISTRPYKVSWKADGTRYMMLIDGENEVYFIDRDNSVFQVAGLRFPDRKQLDRHLDNTLVDGEMVIDTINGVERARYLVYDIIQFKGQEVGKTDFNTRLLCIKKEIVDLRNSLIERGDIDKRNEPFSIRIKDFWDVVYAKNLLDNKFTKQLGHEVDGLIFQPSPDPYKGGRCLETLKWKPSTLNSVDFRLQISVESGEGLVPKKVGFLFVGGLNVPFGKIKVTKSIKDLNNKIIECSYENNQWTFMRERTDKSFPNGLETANGVCRSIRDPVTKERLLGYIDEHRFIARR